MVATTILLFSQGDIPSPSSSVLVETNSFVATFITGSFRLVEAVMLVFCQSQIIPTIIQPVGVYVVDLEVSRIYLVDHVVDNSVD